MDSGSTKTERRSIRYTKSGCLLLEVSKYSLLFHTLSWKKRKPVFYREQQLESVWSVCVIVTYIYQRSVRHSALLRLLHKDQRGLVEICVLFNMACKLTSACGGLWWPTHFRQNHGTLACREILTYGILQVATRNCPCETLQMINTEAFHQYRLCCRFRLNKACYQVKLSLWWIF